MVEQHNHADLLVINMKNLVRQSCPVENGSMEKDLARRAIFETAQAVLSGQLSYLEATRLLLNSLRIVDVDENDVDLMPFVLINSECDHLPIGRQCEFWSVEALKGKAPELARSEEWAKRIAEEHVKNLLRRFHPSS